MWLALFGPRAIDDPAIDEAVAFHDEEQASQQRLLWLVK